MSADSIARLKITLDSVKPHGPAPHRGAGRGPDRPPALVIQAAHGLDRQPSLRDPRRRRRMGHPTRLGRCPARRAQGPNVDVLEDIGVKTVDTSTTSATAGSTRSRSNASARPAPRQLLNPAPRRAACRALSTARNPGAPRDRSSSSPLTTIPSMSATPSSPKCMEPRNLRSSTCVDLDDVLRPRGGSRRSPSNGQESPPSSASLETHPRPPARGSPTTPSARLGGQLADRTLWELAGGRGNPPSPFVEANALIANMSAPRRQAAVGAAARACRVPDARAHA